VVRKIRREDTVEVISGDYVGERGQVLRVIPKGNRVVVRGVNMVKRHRRPGRNRAGGVISMEAPLHVSNVALVCPRCDKAGRVGIAIREDGSRERICKRCDEVVG
jgi:large subunit ribosomal protein L24